MEEWIKGNFRKSIYQNESGYVIGIFKVKEASSESLINYVGRTITFTGYFSDLNTNDTYPVSYTHLTLPTICSV